MVTAECRRLWKLYSRSNPAFCCHVRHANWTRRFEIPTSSYLIGTCGCRSLSAVRRLCKDLSERWVSGSASGICNEAEQ